MEKKRESSFELLRILACLMVIGHHFIIKGNGVISQPDFSVQQLVYMLLLPGGKIGVNCFVLLTGYFLSEKPAGTQRVLRLIWTVTLYSLVGYGLARAWGLEITAESGKAILLPLAYNTMGWFLAPFLAVTMLSEFLNRMLNALDRPTWLRLLVVLGGICLLCPNLLPHSTFFVDQFLWFLYLYVIGAFLRRFSAEWICRRRWLTAAAVGTMLLNVLVQAALRILLHTRPDKWELTEYYALHSNSVFCLASAVALLLLCRSLHFHSRVVNWVAGSCFGVYLLTDCTALGELLWQQVSDWALYEKGAGVFLVSSAATILVTFGLCLVVAKLLNLLLERPLFPVWRWLDARWEALLSWLTRFLKLA